VRAERYWRQASLVSQEALRCGALVPLATEEILDPRLEPFRLRTLHGLPPRHLRESGPRANPFLPWEPLLQVDQLEGGHVVLLNKYPVQSCHLLLITGEWKPQQGWLEGADWRAVAKVAADTGGLWFFNSSALAGASQPHRHLQLLPRRGDEPSCPLAASIAQQLRQEQPPWPWAYRISPRQDPLGCTDLADIYASHCRELGLGQPGLHGQPLHPYNLLFDDRWFLTVRRLQEHCAGFSVNGLGFAGYLLATHRSDLNWLQQKGPWALLEAVAAPAG
jgi:sulfate adenylyltransferase (ADP) / ATP adenylyltransferase